MIFRWLLTSALLLAAVLPWTSARSATIDAAAECIEDVPEGGEPAESCLKTHDVVTMVADTSYALVYPQCDVAKQSPICGRQFEAPAGSGVKVTCNIPLQIPEDKIFVLYGLDFYEYISFDNTSTVPTTFEYLFESQRVIVAVERLLKQKDRVFVSCEVEAFVRSNPDPSPAATDYCMCGVNYPVEGLEETDLTSVASARADSLRPETGPETRIQGGTLTALAKHPWAAAIKPVPGQQVPYCMGVLISKNYVLTSAQALRTMGETLPFVSLGVYNVRYNDEYFTYRAVQKKEYSNPSDSSLSLLDVDFALLKIPAVTPSRTVIPACILDPTVDLSLATGTAIGWGLNKPFNQRARHRRTLHEVDLPIVENSVCEQSFPDFAPINPDTLICAGTPGVNDTTCAGDFGSPLLVRQMGKEYVAGLASLSSGCSPGGDPTVFVKINLAVKTWIDSETDIVEYCP